MAYTDKQKLIPTNVNYTSKDFSFDQPIQVEVYRRFIEETTNFKINDKIDPYLVNAYALSIYKNSIKLNYDLFRDNFNKR